MSGLSTQTLESSDRTSGMEVNFAGNESERRQPFLEAYVRPCMAEFVGTTLFVFLGCMSLQSGQLTVAALGHGLTIAVLVGGFGHISGGHFNPCVTLGAWIGGGLRITLALGYWLVQLTGGILGAACARGVLRNELTVTGESVYDVIHGGGQTLSKGVGIGEGILCELLLTSLLVSTVLMTGVDEDGKTGLAPLLIGLTVAADIMAGGPTTGASMNPARTLGPAVVFSDHDISLWTYHYVYWAGPVLGAVLAGLWYRLMFCSEDKRIPARTHELF